MNRINFIVEDSKGLKGFGSSEVKKENPNDEEKESSKLEERCAIDLIEWLSSENFLPELKKWELENLSRLASNFSRLPGATLSRHINESIIVAIEEKLSEEANLNKQVLCSFAQLCEFWSCNLMQRIAEAFLEARSWDENFTMQELSRLASGFSNWPDQECCHKAMKEISSLIQKDLPTADISEEEICELANALIEWSDKDWIEDTMKVISEAAVKKVFDGKRFTKNRLLKLAIAFSKWSDKAFSFKVVGIIACNNIAIFGVRINYTKEELVQFAIAFSKFSHKNSKLIHDVMQLTYNNFYWKCFKNKEKFTFEQLYYLAIAFGEWPQEVWSVTVASKICKNFDLRAFSNLDLSEQERYAFSKILKRLPKEVLREIEKKLPFILLAPELHEKPQTFGRFLEKLRRKLSKRV